MPSPCTPNHQQQALLALIIAGGHGKRIPTWKRTRHEFLLEYGWWYQPVPRPKPVKTGRQGECFKNAFLLALNNNSLTYCEGFVLSRVGDLPVHHAWVTDGGGGVIDNTLKEPAAAYAGVPFNTNFLNLYHLRNKAVICLLDDHLHDWPLLGDLGDRPGEWLKEQGQGVTRLRQGQ